MKKLKIFSILICAILTFALCLSACGGESEVGSLSNVGNESFKGQISEQSYTDTEVAARAFLKNELDGKTSKTKFISYTKQQDISRDELEKLPLGEIKPSDVTSAEAGTVTYELTSGTGSLLADTEEESTRTHTIYILVVGDRCFYFVPEARNGEMLSNSYYKDLWNLDHYRNSTMTCAIETAVEASGNQGERLKFDMKISITMKLSETGIYMKMDTTIDASGDGAEELGSLLGGSMEAANLETYFIEKDGALWGCIKTESGWVAKVSEYTSVENFFLKNNQQPEFLDYTYFVKTDNGFRIDPTKIQLYVKNYNPAFQAMSNSIDMKAEYIIEDERLKSSVAEIKMEQNAEGAKMGLSMFVKCEYRDYGKTTVTLPADLTEYLETL